MFIYNPANNEIMEVGALSQSDGLCWHDDFCVTKTSEREFKACLFTLKPKMINVSGYELFDEFVKDMGWVLLD